MVSTVATVDINSITMTELDSHANMVVLDKECFTFEATGKTCNVEPFSTALGIVQDILIVDVALSYDCPFTHERYILIIHNTLHIKSMTHNLICPFYYEKGWSHCQ